ncbi:hypothetical protein [Mesorhizobium sp.]|uniref:hypothetical protein n=2 Tax=Mesorhizobium sp. TaxID=1871066 RepID=UPI0025800DE5|nr:hypothetical protein [Mesorhizobium sp.]
MLIATAGTPKDSPICGSDVEMIVESRSCMKKATATINATRRACRAAVAVSGKALFSGMAVMRRTVRKVFPRHWDQAIVRQIDDAPV